MEKHPRRPNLTSIKVLLGISALGTSAGGSTAAAVAAVAATATTTHTKTVHSTRRDNLAAVIDAGDAAVRIQTPVMDAKRKASAERSSCLTGKWKAVKRRTTAMIGRVESVITPSSRSPVGPRLRRRSAFRLKVGRKRDSRGVKLPGKGSAPAAAADTSNSCVESYTDMDETPDAAVSYYDVCDSSACSQPGGAFRAADNIYDKVFCDTTNGACGGARYSLRHAKSVMDAAQEEPIRPTKLFKTPVSPPAAKTTGGGAAVKTTVKRRKKEKMVAGGVREVMRVDAGHTPRRYHKPADFQERLI